MDNLNGANRDLPVIKYREICSGTFGGIFALDEKKGYDKGTNLMFPLKEEWENKLEKGCECLLEIGSKRIKVRAIRVDHQGVFEVL